MHLRIYHDCSLLHLNYITREGNESLKQSHFDTTTGSTIQDESVQERNYALLHVRKHAEFAQLGCQLW